MRLAVVSVSLALEASAPPNQSDVTNVEIAVKKTLIGEGSEQKKGIEVKNFVVTSTQTSRRLLGGQEGPRHDAVDRMLATYTWTVSFDVVVVLTEYQQSVSSPTIVSPQAFQSTIVSQLSAPAFLTTVQLTGVSVVTTVAPPVTVLRTNTPTSQPSPQPSPQPTSQIVPQIVKPVPFVGSAGFIAMIVAIVGIFVFGVALVVRKQRQRQDRGSKIEPPSISRVQSEHLEIKYADSE